MRKIEILPVGATGRKMVEYFPNGITIQCVEAEYTKGLVDIHITYKGENGNGNGYKVGTNLKELLPKEAIETAEFLGARVNKNSIVYGKTYIDPKAKISKLADIRVIAQYISESLSN
jgi:hypothetical protein